MIKGDYFLKLLKPLFSILLIGFFGLLGSSSVNAGYTQLIGVENYPSLYDSNYSLSFLKGGGFLSNFLGQGKSILALKNNDLIWWAPNGYLYAYLGYSYHGNGVYQGFFDRFYSCDEITDFGDSAPGNCTIGGYIAFTGSYLDSNREIFKSFFSKVKQGDFFYYDYVDTYHIGGSRDGRENWARVCWSSSEIGKSICFQGGLCTSNYSSYCNPLINSQNLRDNLTFSTVENSWIGKAPGQQGYNGEYNGSSEGSVVVNPDNTYTGDYTYTECTFSNVYNQLNKMGYNPYLCYGGLDNYDNLILTGIYNAQPGTGVNMLGIYTHSSHNSDKQSWFNYWNTSYTNQYVSSRDIWYNEPASLYFLFKYYNEYGGNNLEFLSVWEYCNIDWIVNNMSTMPDSKYTGSNFQYVCDIIKAKDIMDGIGGNDGENVEGLNWDGVGVLSGGKTYNDPGQFITDMFTKIKSYIPTDGSDIGLGFLPAYIITFMLFLMLFRFLSH